MIRLTDTSFCPLCMRETFSREFWDRTALAGTLCSMSYKMSVVFPLCGKRISPPGLSFNVPVALQALPPILAEKKCTWNQEPFFVFRYAALYFVRCFFYDLNFQFYCQFFNSLFLGNFIFRGKSKLFELLVVLSLTGQAVNVSVSLKLAASFKRAVAVHFYKPCINYAFVAYFSYGKSIDV